MIEVQLLGPTTTAGGNDKDKEIKLKRGWIVQRRYSEFWTLHQSLKEVLPAIRALETDLPGRRLVPLTNHSFIEARRIALARYLTRVLVVPEAVTSSQLATFLARDVLPPTRSLQRSDQSAARTLLGTFVKGATGVAEGLDELIKPATMYDAVVEQLTLESPLSIWTPVPFKGMAERRVSRQALSQAQLTEAQVGSQSLLNISDLFIEVFELQSADNWLRRQAVVIVLQQLLAGTIQRKLSEGLGNVVGVSAIRTYVDQLLDTLWPSGCWRKAGTPRTSVQKAETREMANEQISTLVPEMAANMIGRQNARRGVRSVFAMLQNQRLNKHLLYTLLDLIIDELLKDA